MFRLVKKINLTFFLVLFCASINAQNYDFKHYSIKDGMSQSVVNCVFQDKEGYIWFGTQNGLNRFDGYTFKKFISNPLDNKSITDNWIFDINETKNGNLLIATQNGLHIYNKKTDAFTRIEHKQKKSKVTHNAIYGIALSKTEGRIYLNTVDEVYVIDSIESANPKIRVFSTGFPSNKELSDKRFYICEDRNGTVWAASQYGLASVFPDSVNAKPRIYSVSDGLLSDNITMLFKENSGRIWIGSQNGLQMIKKDGTFKNIIDSVWAKSLAYDAQNKAMWLGTETNGLIRLTFKDKEIFSDIYESSSANPNSLSHNNIYSLWIDRTNNLWVGTLVGADKLDLKKKKFQLYQRNSTSNSIPLAGNVMAAIFENDDGNLWLGNWGTGLNIYNRKTGEITYYASQYTDSMHLSNDFVHSIFKDKNGNVWVGTRNGINIYNSETKSFSLLENLYKNADFPDFTNNRIYCIFQDNKDNIALGTASGFHLLNLKNGTSESFFAENSQLSSNLVYSAIQDSDGEYWIATTQGLDRYNPQTKKFSHYKNIPGNANSVADNFIVSLCQTKDKKIWIGTNSGLNRFDKKTAKFEFFSDFPSNIIYDIIEDHNGNLWLSSGYGLVEYNSEKKTFINFDTNDGLQSTEFNIKSAFIAKDGEMFFGGMNGFNSFYPDSLVQNSFLPSLIISKFMKENISGKEIINLYSTKEVVLTHEDYAFTIEFSALDFTNPEKNKFAYKMDGLSDRLIEYGNQHSVTFLNLPAGKYTFTVFGSNSDGIWNNLGASVTIEILPPWWKSKVAYGIYFLIIIFSIISFVRLRVKSLKLSKRLLEQKVEERTEMLKASNEEVLQQRNTLQEHHDLILAQNDEINDSLRYAQRIQNAVLPTDEIFANSFANSFVFYKPKEIVGGDFYWAKTFDNKIVVSVADCTGHGVPGGFVSMLCISLLNEVVGSGKKLDAGTILNKTRDKLKDALKQQGKSNESKDGMDISLCIIDKNKMQIEFAGANNDGFLCRNNEITEMKSDRMPIGIYNRESPFQTRIYDIKQNDKIYLFSDGFYDQFGGKQGRKYMKGNFKNLILKISELSFETQNIELQKELENWKDGYAQIDDITVLSFQV